MIALVGIGLWLIGWLLVLTDPLIHNLMEGNPFGRQVAAAVSLIFLWPLYLLLLIGAEK